MCRADLGQRSRRARFDGRLLCPSSRPDTRLAEAEIQSETDAKAGRGAALMDRFVSNFTSRLDAKGRVSIPASFRSVLTKDGYEGLYVHQGLDLAALDAGGNALRATIDDILARFSPFSDEWELLSTALNGTSEVLKIDPEGRVMLSDALKVHAGIADQVTFVGHGHKFQIWEPARFQAHLETARSRLRDVKRSLGAQPTVPGPAGTTI